MCPHAGFWVGGAGEGKLIMAQECSGHQMVTVALSVSPFVLYILLIRTVAVAVPFICCSVKLPLSQPMSFSLFLSILLPTPVGGRGNRVTTWPFVAGHGQTATLNLALKRVVGIRTGMRRVCKTTLLQFVIICSTHLLYKFNSRW